MLLKMAWRNIWRHKGRTLITVVALSVGVAGIVFMHSYGGGVWSEVVSMMTRTTLGHLQIRANGYQDEPSIHKVVPDPMAVEAELGRLVPGARPLKRVMGFGLIAAEEISTASMIVGLEPDRERTSTGLLSILEGRDLGSSAAGKIVLGVDLARQLDVAVGDEVVLIAEATDGSMANDLYEVVGLADAGSADMNAGAVFLHLADAQEFFVIGEGVHQILVNIEGQGEDVSGPVEVLRAALDLRTLEVLGWSEIAPELEAIVRSKRQGFHWVDVLVFIIVALGILNTMAMSAFERTREFGVMASLGTSRSRILGLVVTESVMQCLVGLVAGVGLGVALLYGIGSIDISAFAEASPANLRMPEVIVLRPSASAIISAFVTVLVTALAGGLWPAWKASRLNPVDAVRHV